VVEEEKMQEKLATTGTESLVSETVANLKGIPTLEDLKRQLEQNVLEVSFNKLNGDKRVMTCTLRTDMKPSATKEDPLSQKKIRDLAHEVVNVWDVNAQGWRSFRYVRVNYVNMVEEYEQNWYNNIGETQ